MKSWPCKGSLALAMCFLPLGMPAQTGANSPCALASPQFTTNAPNIFNDRQEQDLGDALAEYFESDMRIAPPVADDQLTRIGEKLLKTLPPTGIQYRFRIYDSGEINAFSLAGGRVYVSRKLIAAAKSEDELAGVLAHEIGHLSMHQTAIEMTYWFKVRLGITEVGDRADILAKVHKFLSTPPKDNEAEQKETKDELVADHVAIYALVRAGYDAGSFPTFFNQISLNKGKTGSWLTDVFGLTHEESRRYREAMKMVGELPAGCTGNPAPASPAFLAWQQSVIQERVKNAASTAPGDNPVKLDAPLRPSPWRIRFSPDGKKALVQDEGSITVVGVEAQKVLFRIDAPDANAAQFTPDSANVVFDDDKLRVERWNVASGQRTYVKELVVFDGCDQNGLAPDGETLVCLKLHLEEDNARISLSLIDVDTGKAYFEKPKFYEAGMFTSFYNLLSLAVDALTGANFANIQMDPEGRFVLVAIATRAEAFDLEKRQPVALGGKLKNMGNTRMAFLGPDAIFAVGDLTSKGLYKAQVLSFPDGKALNETQIGDQSFHGATKGPLLLMGPLKDYPVAIFDPATSKILAGWQFDAIDVWDKKVAAENGSGGLFVSQLGSTDSAQIPLPLGPLPPPHAASFSPDGKYLVVSLRSRSEVWDVATGKHLRLMRPISSLSVDDEDRLWAILPKYMNHDATIIEMPLAQLSVRELGKVDVKKRQFGNLQYTLKPMGRGTGTDRHVTLEVENMETQAVLWSRDFPNERPAVWPSGENRIALGWDLNSETARDEVKKYPKLQEETRALASRKRGLLIETLDARTGAAREQVALPEVDLTRGWNDERFAQLSGEFALVRGEHGNTVIYKLDTAAKVGEFFGAPLATDVASGLIAAINREDEILMVNERTGKELQRFNLGSPARLAQIIPGKPAMLLVLTEDQVVHRVPLAE